MELDDDGSQSLLGEGERRTRIYEREISDRYNDHDETTNIYNFL